VPVATELEQPLVGEILDARHELQAQPMAQREDVVRNPAGIGVMELRPQDGVVGQQARKNVERFVLAAGNHLVRKGAELVRSVRVNR
jgi:hypothetical protein